MSYEEIDYKIFTMTVSCIYKNTTFNLVNIGKYLDIDSNILGIKYNYGDTSILKGIYTTAVYNKLKVKNTKKINTILFYNQVSLSIKVNDNVINAKLFSNGSLHLTGVKDSSEPKIIMYLLYNKLLNLKNKNDTLLLCSDSNGIYTDNNNMIYSSGDKKRVMGYFSNNKYIMDKKVYNIDFYTGYFISDKIETKRTRNILDFNGEIIGYTRIELMKNKLKLYKNNSNVHFDHRVYNDSDRPYNLIYYDGNGYSLIIGKIVYYIDIDIENKNSIIEPVINYTYNCNPFIIENNFTHSAQSDLSDQIDIEINCINIYFNMKFELNRNRLLTELLKDKYICELKSEKYAGLKFIYKKSLNKQDIPGICKCTLKCTCTNITFSIFQSGNVNVFGFKQEQDIKNVLNDFNKIITKYKDTIKKRTLTI